MSNVRRQVGERPESCMLLRCHAFAMRPSVKVGGGAIGAMPTSPPIGSSGVSRVPVLPIPLGIDFPAQFRLVPLQSLALASVGGQAGKKRVLRKLPPMPTPVSPAHSWVYCAGLVTLYAQPGGQPDADLRYVFGTLWCRRRLPYRWASGR